MIMSQEVLVKHHHSATALTVVVRNVCIQFAHVSMVLHQTVQLAINSIPLFCYRLDQVVTNMVHLANLHLAPLEENLYLLHLVISLNNHYGMQ